MFRPYLAAAAVIVFASLAPYAVAADFGSWTDQQREEFLLAANPTKFKTLDSGVTQSQRATLELDGVIHYAHFQTINESKPFFQTEKVTEMNFRDSYKYNIAAYRIDRMIGLGLVPVSVERRTGRKTGAMTWWIDGVRMTDKDRRSKGLTPPNVPDWNDQMFNIRVFNELIYNVDPNLGNIVITDEWLPRPLDFTRSFRLHKTLRRVENLERIDRRVYEGLKSLTKEAVTAELGDLLTEPELDALLARRDFIVAFFDNKIAERGEATAICDRPGH